MNTMVSDNCDGISKVLLDLRNVTIYFLTEKQGVIRAVNKVNLTIHEKEAHGLVGESGSGKTVTALAILGLIDLPGCVVQGEIIWQGQNLLAFSESAMNEVRGGGIAMVFQNAPSSLNPALRIETQMIRLLRFRRGMKRFDARQESLKLLATVRLQEPERAMRCYPHELSGGMAQRVALALALACEPKLLIADEPTSSVDVMVATQLLELFADLRGRKGISILLITHDMGAVARLCNRVSVIYRGEIVDHGVTTDVFRSPKHPYTQALLRSALLSQP